jgi:hypothetical protein
MAKLNSKKRKKSSFYEEKSLVGLTPEQFSLLLHMRKKLLVSKVACYLAYYPFHSLHFLYSGEIIMVQNKLDLESIQY